MNNNPNSPRRDKDDVAAVPLTHQRRFNPLWFLLLLLIPLLMLPFCHHRDDNRAPAATPTPTADVTKTSATPSPMATTNSAANPFTINASGPDVGKAVLNFDANATTPNAPAASLLKAVVAYLQANPAAKVSLKGFTDNTGTAELNRKLTQQRIDSVKSALTGAGIDAGRIEAANFGEAYPVANNSDAQARELNRRVEVTLVR